MASTGEIIHLHIGQAGVQIANACWELYCLEHGIDANGNMYHCTGDKSFQTFFSLSNHHKLVPNVLMADSEPAVVDEVRTGAYGKLFKPETIVAGNDDSGSNFARGYYTTGNELIGLSINAVRLLIEGCSNLRGFLSLRSMGGGTGSGFGTRLMEEIMDEFGKRTMIDYVIYPSPSLSVLTVETYNSILASHANTEGSDCTFVVENGALFDICENKLHFTTPTYTNLNRIIGQSLSSLTAGQRFQGSANMLLTEFPTNLVPFPRIHYALMSLSPIVTMCTSYYIRPTVEELTLAAFQPINQFVRCDPAKGKIMSCALLYRGNVKPADINHSVALMKAKGWLKFPEWSPAGFKIAINGMPSTSVPGGDIGPSDKSMLTLTNSTNMRRVWCRLHHNFTKLYARRAFLHHFASEGVEQDHFVEASEDICTLINDYAVVDGVEHPFEQGSGSEGQSRAESDSLHRSRSESDEESDEKKFRLRFRASLPINHSEIPA